MPGKVKSSSQSMKASSSSEPHKTIYIIWHERDFVYSVRNLNVRAVTPFEEDWVTYDNYWLAWKAKRLCDGKSWTLPEVDRLRFKPGKGHTGG